MGNGGSQMKLELENKERKITSLMDEKSEIEGFLEKTKTEKEKIKQQYDNQVEVTKELEVATKKLETKLHSTEDLLKETKEQVVKVSTQMQEDRNQDLVLQKLKEAETRAEMAEKKLQEAQERERARRDAEMDEKDFMVHYSGYSSWLKGQKVLVSKEDDYNSAELLEATVLEVFSDGPGWKDWYVKVRFTDRPLEEYDQVIAAYSRRLRPLSAKTKKLPTKVIVNKRKMEALGSTKYLAVPTIAPNGGTFEDSVAVRCETSSENAVIRYTTDGTIPTVFDSVYTVPIILQDSVRLIARAFHGDVGSAATGATFKVRRTSQSLYPQDNA
eukprot:Nk52_evm14s805 gene=Nk52_evmTU14s805